MQIKFWLISALIQIVRSEEYFKNWSTHEKGQFVTTFLDWIETEGQPVFEISHFKRKLSLLFAFTFQSSINSASDTNGWNAAFTDFITRFLNMQKWPNYLAKCSG